MVKIFRLVIPYSFWCFFYTFHYVVFKILTDRKPCNIIAHKASVLRIVHRSEVSVVFNKKSVSSRIIEKEVFSMVSEKRKRVYTSFGLFVFVIAAVTLFGFGVVFSQNVLRVWFGGFFGNPAGEQYVRDLLEKFGTENGIKTEFTLVRAGVAREKIAAAVEVGDPPDLVLDTALEGAGWYTAGALENLQDVFSAIAKRGTLWPVVYKFCSDKEFVWGIPPDVTVTLLYSRMDILRDAGFNNPPNTYDELELMAKKAQQPPQIYGYGMPLGLNDDTETTVEQMIWAYGGTVVGEDAKTVTIKSPHTAQVLETINKWYHEDKIIPPDATGWDTSGNNQIYQMGGAVFVYNPLSVFNWLEENNPEMLKNTALSGPPAGPGGTGHIGRADSFAWIVFKDAKNKDLAKQFLLSLFEIDNYSAWLEKIGGRFYPIYQEVALMPFWQRPEIKLVNDAVKDAVPLGWPGGTTPGYQSILKEHILSRMVQRVVIDAWSSQEAMDEAEGLIQRIYEQF